MSRRTERIASLIRTILADAMLRRLSDPRIPAITSITRVEVSEDLSVAKVFVSVLAPSEARRKLAHRALQQAAGHLRRLLGQELSLRTLPQLVFKLDDSLRKGFETVQLIDQLGLAAGAVRTPEPSELDEAGDASPALQDVMEDTPPDGPRPSSALARGSAGGAPGRQEAP